MNIRSLKLSAVKNRVRLTLIRESWKKNPKRGTITERPLRKKNPERSIEELYICFCALDFFPEMTLGHGPKNGIYFCSARHISSHIGICHLKFAP